MVLALLKYLLVFGTGLAGLVSALRTLRRGWSLWRHEPEHRFNVRTFLTSEPHHWQNWPASHWLAAGTLVLIVSLGLVAMGVLD